MDEKFPRQLSFSYCFPIIYFFCLGNLRLGYSLRSRCNRLSLGVKYLLNIKKSRVKGELIFWGVQVVIQVTK